MNLLLPHFILIVFVYTHVTLLPSYLVLINKLETSMVWMSASQDHLPEVEEPEGKQHCETHRPSSRAVLADPQTHNPGWKIHHS